VKGSIIGATGGGVNCWIVAVPWANNPSDVQDATNILTAQPGVLSAEPNSQGHLDGR